jgi:hypothetical protein
MAHEIVKTMVSGCLGGLIGAFLSVFVGAYIGAAITSKDPEMATVHRDSGGTIAINVNACSWIPGMLIGGGIGGIIGAIGGSVLGAGLAAKASSRLPEDFPSVKKFRPGDVPKRPTQSPDDELPHLKERVAELEAKKRMDERFKEEWPPSLSQ